MPDPTGEFFDQLGRRGHEPLLEEVNGTIRFVLRDEHGIDEWYVEIKNGDLRVSREAQPADCIMHGDRATFDLIVLGKLNRMVAWLRHLIWVDGEGELFRIFSNILPKPADAHDPRDLVRRRGQRR